ncbi:hypothetical protein [Naasia lichenicola]|uniref:Uncharacterized protein n=1 Tax=Naasia lichenicola TaxID=2565933 RepID=A0A4S4FIG4_9MICO|nr:hypothetical protein [Naasia lichenicola]THG29632.1 hypothetical protein E6C64_13235 [Naasia lichenicola]
MTTQFAPTPIDRAAPDEIVAPQPVSTGEMLRRFGQEEVLSGARVKRREPQLASDVVLSGTRQQRRSSYVRLGRERVLMIVATIALGFAITGMAYAVTISY